MAMNKELKALWLENLQNGSYVHMRNALCPPRDKQPGDGACPRCIMGVLLDILPLAPSGVDMAQLQWGPESCTYSPPEDEPYIPLIFGEDEEDELEDEQEDEQEEGSPWLPESLLEVLGITERQQERLYSMNDQYYGDGEYPLECIEFIKENL